MWMFFDVDVESVDVELTMKTTDDDDWSTLVEFASFVISYFFLSNRKNNLLHFAPVYCYIPFHPHYPFQSKINNEMLNIIPGNQM